MLSKAYCDTIRLYASGMKGILPAGDRIYSKEEIVEIEKIARRQGVWTVVFAVLKKLSEAGRLAPEITELPRWQMEIQLKVMEYTLRQEAMYRFVEEELSFANPITLKGDLISDLYANPELRMSGDTDLLIDPKDEEAVLKKFQKAGGDYMPRGEINNQAVCVHPKAGKFEIHISLDTKEVTEVWYDNLDFGAEEKQRITLKNGHTVMALGVTDSAINMVLHVLKHLISGIAHLKMLGDAILYLSHYADRIDFSRVDAVMAQLGYVSVYETIKRIGVLYFGFSNLTSSADYDQLTEKFLKDIEFCAENGFAEEKLTAYNEYSKAKYESYHKKNYTEYKKELTRRTRMERLFPKKTVLYGEYPILMKQGWLLPFIWIVRIFRKMFGKKTVLPAEQNPRLKLMKELGLL
ncbi:MAG: nucleotidyltransferase family protein [Clostridia bacterium]|nr:nucleotidyltransferase family protein [Clostridia bacterium]